MKTHRLLSVAIVLIAILAAWAVVLDAVTPRLLMIGNAGSPDFQFGIYITVSASVPLPRVNAIVNGSRGVLLDRVVFSWPTPGEVSYNVAVPWAQTDSDAEEVVRALDSHAEIVSANSYENPTYTLHGIP